MCYCTCSDVMHTLCDAHMQASQPPLYKHGTLEITYGHANHASQTVPKKNNHFTF